MSQSNMGTERVNPPPYLQNRLNTHFYTSFRFFRLFQYNGQQLENIIHPHLYAPDCHSSSELQVGVEPHVFPPAVTSNSPISYLPALQFPGFEVLRSSLTHIWPRKLIGHFLRSVKSDTNRYKNTGSYEIWHLSKSFFNHISVVFEYAQ